MVQRLRAPSPPITASLSRDRTTSLQKWSRRTRIWSVSASVCSTRARASRRVSRGDASAKARRLASRCSSRSSKSASAAKRTWRNGSRDLNAVRFSRLLCTLIFYLFKPRGKKEHKVALQNAQADDDGFDVAVEDAIADRRPAKRRESRLSIRSLELY